MKIITGTWMDFYHPNDGEGTYFNDQTAAFTAEQWGAKVDEMCDTGMDTLVVMMVALEGKAFYPSRHIPDRWQPMACDDPLEAVLTAADRRGTHVFVGVGFFQQNTGAVVADETDARLRTLIPRELNERYGHHTSLYGWYLPVEARIDGHFDNNFMAYAQSFCADLKRIEPRRPVMIAPYGTRTAVPDDRFVEQLKSLGVDFIAYQDEVGVKKTGVEELEQVWANLRKAHDQAGIPLWADVELFTFEGPVYHSALLPAPFERIQQQLAVAARYVDKVLCYQYLGILDKPGSLAPAGHPDAQELYRRYVGG